MGRHATRLVLGQEARMVRERFSDRIMGSRYVVTWKEEEDAPVRVKARWCLQGHLDPDLQTKALAGDLQSPTLSQLGRALLFQTIASKKWTLKKWTLALGDVKGAFLSSGALPERYRPLYARLPAGGIPGVPSDALIEVLGRVYGLNDSPSAWSKTLNAALLEVGFERSRLDPCLYYMRDKGVLTGIFGVHVDDNATGGEGAKYHQALEALKKKFEFRKWNAELTPDEIKCFRAINGSLNWLATQSRPDLSTQVSFAQQSLPTPRVSDALAVNQAIRRARQHAALPLVYQSIPLEQLTVMVHSDAAYYANGKDGATQAGYMISFTEQQMHHGSLVSWTPGFWKSYRLPRVVNSTLSAEAQAMVMATGMAEWSLLLMSECIDGRTFLQSMWNTASRRESLVVTDCKSLFDHVQSQSAPTLDDRRTALDIVILRESLSKTGGSLRWVPTTFMLADSLTKESPEAFDLLRGCIRRGYYQICPESVVLQTRADERARRKELAKTVPTPDEADSKKGKK
ncbi:GIP [Symbiodinium sp. CCMP2592]|nr:GIP [Symbiodinium sp. CCMP2592]